METQNSQQTSNSDLEKKKETQKKESTQTPELNTSQKVSIELTQSQKQPPLSKVVENQLQINENKQKYAVCKNIEPTNKEPEQASQLLEKTHYKNTFRNYIFIYHNISGQLQGIKLVNMINNTYIEFPINDIYLYHEQSVLQRQGQWNPIQSKITQLEEQVKKLQAQCQQECQQSKMYQEILKTQQNQIQCIQDGSNLKKPQIPIEKICQNCRNELQWCKSTEISVQFMQCYICKKSKLCRYFCQFCKSYFCLQCQKIQFKKNYCPNNHLLVNKFLFQSNIICDICLKFDKYSQSSIFSCSICDYDICDKCNSLIPN